MGPVVVLVAWNECSITFNNCFLGMAATTINSGENVWKKGTGFLTAMQFIKIDFSSNEFTISALVQAGLGSVGGNEMDLTGVVAAIPKKLLLNVIEQIKRAF